MGSQTLRAAAAWIELGKLPEVSRSTTAGVKRHVHGPEPPQPPQPESGSWQEVRLVHTITQAQTQTALLECCWCLHRYSLMPKIC